MADIKDILGVKKAVDVVAAAGPRPTAGAGAKPKRPPGMGRELFGLIGPAGVHSLVPTGKKATGLKQKRKIVQKVSKWSWAPFKNSGREDGYEFRHWTKWPDSPYDYVFARFNKPSHVLKYTDDEYKNFLQSSQWTREQTDTLIDLATRFSARFSVVRDRLPFEKSIEDIKDRFYSIQRIILDARAPTQEDKAKLGANPLVSNPYDKEYEISRKQHLERLYSRTRQQEAEEEALLYEYHKLEHLEKKHKKEVSKYNAQLRKRGLVVSAPVPAVAGVAPVAAAPVATGRSRKKANRKRSASGALKVTTVNTGSASSNANVVPAQTSVTHLEEESATGKFGSPRPANRKMGPGTYLRSTKLADARPPGAKLVKQKLINDKLAAMGLTYLPMATEKCVDKYGQVRLAVSDLITIEKDLSRKIQELSTLEQKLAKAGLSSAAPAAPAAKRAGDVPPPPKLARPGAAAAGGGGGGGGGGALPPPPPVARPTGDAPLAPLNKRGAAAADSSQPNKKQRR